MARIFECPLWMLEPECEWTWTLADMPEDFKNHKIELRRRAGGTFETTLSTSVREHFWLEEHKQGLHDAVAEHLRTHSVNDLVEHLAWKPYEDSIED